MALSNLFLACGSASLSGEISPDAPTTQDDLALSLDESESEVSSITWTMNGKDQPALADARVIPSSVTEKGQIWEAKVEGPQAHFSVSTTIHNTAPSATSASISPESPGATDTLSCVPEGFSDVDSDPEAWKYLWEVNDEEAGEQASLATELEMGDQVSCTAWPVDLDSSGLGVSAEVVIGNTAPSITSMSIEPIAPSTESELSYTVEAEDIDGDALSFSAEWRVNGERVHIGPTLAAEYFEREDEVSLTLSPSDGLVSGPAIQTRTLIENASPTLVSVSMDPSDPDRTDRIVASALGTDPDSDALQTEFSWWLNGEELSEGPSLPAGLTERGDQLQLKARISDGEFTEFGQVTVTVANAAPAAPTLAILPAGGPVAEVDDLVCAIETPSVDPDGDTVSYSILWTRDGMPYFGLQSESILENDTVPASVLNAGEDWTCMMNSSDGETITFASVSTTVLTCASSVETFVASASASVDPSDNSAIEETGVSVTEDNQAWLLFDLSGLPERSFVTEATLSLHTQSAGVQGSPSLFVLGAPADSWTSTSPTVDITSQVSESISGLSSESWAEFEIDVSTWKWEQALSTQTSSLGVSSGGQAEAFAKFFDQSESGKEPTLTLTMTICE